MAMDMKKVTCAVLVAAATVSSAMAVEAPAQAPTSGAQAALPAVGALVGASLVSFFAFFLH
ncbi:arabinogalactan protein 23-like [Camellia sinensis]|uniref:arabinogalactan protein 23-like n=1 Tax=Camellia sinensis TaxID=4442 RepID=UPI0010356D17|nr:arabinogalactan protein 23-like [Camellia sinensis]